MVISPNKGHRVKLEHLRMFAVGDAVIQQEQGVLNGMLRYIATGKANGMAIFSRRATAYTAWQSIGVELENAGANGMTIFLKQGHSMKARDSFETCVLCTAWHSMHSMAIY